MDFHGAEGFGTEYDGPGHRGVDPLTGLANRRAFCDTLEQALAREPDEDRSLALFAIDAIHAIFMQYGQQTTDEIRWGFAKFLTAMTGDPQELALLGEDRFAVLLPGMTMRAARGWAGDVLATFASLAAGSPGRAPELTASAGLARVETSVDWTLRQAEMGLVMARAGGGMQVGICRLAGATRELPILPSALVAARRAWD